MDNDLIQHRLTTIHMHVEVLAQRKTDRERQAIKQRVQSFNLPEHIAQGVYSTLARELRESTYNKVLNQVLELAEAASHDLFTKATGVPSPECEKGAELESSAGESNAGTRASDPECRSVPDVGAAVGAAENDRSRAQIAEFLEQYVAQNTSVEESRRIKLVRMWLQGSSSVIPLLSELLGEYARL